MRRARKSYGQRPPSAQSLIQKSSLSDSIKTQKLSSRSNIEIDTQQPVGPPPSRLTGDLSIMMNIKWKIETIINMMNTLIIENDDTPEIQLAIEQPVRRVQESYPPFHNQGMHYFQKHQSMLDSAKTTQVISSASVRLPLETFQKQWKALTELIDLYSTLHPPPHAKEISTKFKTIRSSLDVIQQTNEKRKYPSITLSKCVWSIQSLCDSLTSNIVELFSQPSFPNFQSDLFKSFRTDVKSFLGVVNEAFANEFVQSGVLLSDLSRIKSNIFVDCNSIIESLRCAFAFPAKMQEIREIKDDIETDLNPIFAKLSIPFAKIKPNEAVLAAMAVENAKLEKVDRFVREKEKIKLRKAEAEEMRQKFMDSFIVQVGNLMGQEFDLTKDLNENLSRIYHWFRDLIEENKRLSQEVKDQKSEVQKQKETSKDFELIYQEKSVVMDHVKIQLDEQIKALKDENNSLKDNLNESSQRISSLEAAVHDLEQKEGPEFLRSVITELNQMLIQKLGAKQCQIKDDKELADISIKNLQKVLNLKCKKCIETQKQIEKLQFKLAQLTDVTDIDSPLEDLVLKVHDKIEQLQQEREEMKQEIERSQKVLKKAGLLFDVNEDSDPYTLSKAIYHKVRESIENNKQEVLSRDKKEDSYIKLLVQISEKMVKIINQPDFSVPILEGERSNQRSIIIETISTQLRKIKSIISNQAATIDDYEAKDTKNEETMIINQQKLSEALKIPIDDDFFDKCVESIKGIDKPLFDQIEDLKRQNDEAKSMIGSIRMRLSGVCGKNEDETVWTLIDCVQDTLESQKKYSKKAEDDAAALRECLLSIDNLLSKTALVNPIVPSNDHELIKSAQEHADMVASGNQSDEIILSSEMMNILQPVNQYVPPANLHAKAYLSLVIKHTLELEKSIEGITSFDENTKKMVMAEGSSLIDVSQLLTEQLKSAGPIIKNNSAISVLFRFISVVSLLAKKLYAE